MGFGFEEKGNLFEKLNYHGYKNTFMIWANPFENLTPPVEGLIFRGSVLFQMDSQLHLKFPPLCTKF